ncbi:NucA/NucB deoxyribonuclease domain-containing protein [Streptomyces sp. NPDC050485]|uniref:NucA/NucB deoxyribonuclease domain-containing protein n=1 Tax=Streptomyces sp. NPDC050485 TaxID=3365617 RepID=UPI00379591E6
MLRHTFARAAAAGVAALALIWGSAGGASAHAAQPGKSELSVHVRKITPKWHGAMPKGATKANALSADTDPTGCGDPWWWLEWTNETLRTSHCQDEQDTINLIRWVNRVPEIVGTAKVTISHLTMMSTTSLTWSEQVTVSKADLSGEARKTPITMSLLAFAKPNTTLHRTGQLAGAFTLSGTSQETGAIDYSSQVHKMQEVWDSTKYVYFADAVGFPLTIASSSGPEWRCDDVFWDKKTQKQHTKVPGCVLPFQAAYDASPVFVPSGMYGLKGIRQNIQTVQKNGVHIGRPFSGKPLHRTTDAQRANNYKAVCAGLKPPSPGLSCDEYPFASTAEGGTFFAPPNRGIAWVSVQEQRQQGGFLRAFYSQSRILPGDPFYVNVLA